jgi:uncharacterized protein YprB with RNaseH-like and TPR domain
MSSWEEIANEVVPANAPVRGLATGAHRKSEGAREGARIVPPFKKHVVVAPDCGPDAPLQIVLQGDNRETENGAFFHIARDAKEFHENYFDLQKLLGGAVDIVAQKTRAKIGAEDLLFLDIETTGLSSSVPLFLIGSLHAGKTSSGSQLELFLARTQREERAAIADFLKLVEGKTLVSFNGKSFDWPFIEGRALRHGLKIPAPRAHFDLLHLARSKWKTQVPNCRLQTLEYYLCGRIREGDVASSKIPDQYWEFSEIYEASGLGAHLMTPIVHHNTWDVLTMADLLRRAQQSSP